MYIVTHVDTKGFTYMFGRIRCFSTIEEIKEARDNDQFSEMNFPDCFYCDPISHKLVRQPIEFLKENVWSNYL